MTISKKTKIQLFNNNGKSILIYACETWKHTAVIERRLDVFVSKCLRRICNIKWFDHIPTEDLSIITEQKLRWEKKMDNHSNIAKQALDWNPQGTRKRGRPTTMYKRTILNGITREKSWRQIKNLNDKPGNSTF